MSARIVVVGGGFAGLTVARRLERRVPGAEISLVDPSDHMLYLPLLPQVAAGVLPARAAVVALSRRLRRTRLVPARAIGVDPDARRVVLRRISGDDETLAYDRLVLAPGSVTNIREIPGLADLGRGMKTLAEADYLRDHVLAQLELAAATTDADERARRCRFVVVGGGYTGVETAANLQLMTRAVARRYPRLDPGLLQWHLVQHSSSLLPQLGDRLGRDTVRVLRGRGIRVDLGTSLTAARPGAVELDDGRSLATETLVWAAGVTANPLVGNIGCDTDHGRLVVGADLAVPGRPEILALGDAAAVPDLVTGGGATCPPTAQHAVRQAPVAAENVATGLAGAPLRQYRHHDLGMVVDLGGAEAVAKPLGVGLAGLPAQAVTRAYHLWAVGAPDTVRRVAANWVLHALGGDSSVRLGLDTDTGGRLAAFEHVDDYLTVDRARAVIATT